MKKTDEIAAFCKRHNLTTDQFYGKSTIPGSLDLSSLTTLPEGCALTVGGDLDLSSLTTLPEGCALTVGRYLYLSSLTTLPEGCALTVGESLYLSSLTTLPEGCALTVGGSLDLRNEKKHIGDRVPEIELTWQNGKYRKIDGIFCEVAGSPHTVNGFETLRLKKINKNEYFFLAKKDNFYSHGATIQKAVEDLRFKIIAEKLKKEPILKNTIITRQYYRIITGACGFGVNDWMEKNKVTKEEITAEELLPILEKTNAYGLERFKALMA